MLVEREAHRAAAEQLLDPPTGTVEVGQTPTLHVTGSNNGRSGDVFY